MSAILKSVIPDHLPFQNGNENILQEHRCPDDEKEFQQYICRMKQLLQSSTMRDVISNCKNWYFLHHFPFVRDQSQMSVILKSVLRDHYHFKIERQLQAMKKKSIIISAA